MSRAARYAAAALLGAASLAFALATAAVAGCNDLTGVKKITLKDGGGGSGAEAAEDDGNQGGANGGGGS